MKVYSDYQYKCNKCEKLCSPVTNVKYQFKTLSNGTVLYLDVPLDPKENDLHLCSNCALVIFGSIPTLETLE